MNRLIDKGIIWFMCLISYTVSDSLYIPIISILSAAGFSALIQIFKKRNISCIILVIWSALCLFFPQLFNTVPLMLYDALCLKKPYISLLSLTALVNISEFDYIQLELNLAGILISLLLFFRTSELKKYVLLLHETRDSSAQANMTLKQKNKQLMEQQDNEIYLATLKERNRIAREIHDNVGHMLTRSLLQIGALIIVTKDETQNQALSGIKDTLDSAMTSIRTSVHNLHDNSIDLKQAACECIKSIETKFTVAFDFDVSYNTPKNIKLCIIGVLKESLSNIAKHCSGNNVKISIIEHPKFYQLSVKDNGCCKGISSDGMGLINMRERAENLNGIINFTPSDKGFTVFMSIPKP